MTADRVVFKEVPHGYRFELMAGTQIAFTAVLLNHKNRNCFNSGSLSCTLFQQLQALYRRSELSSSSFPLLHKDSLL